MVYQFAISFQEDSGIISVAVIIVLVGIYYLFFFRKAIVLSKMGQSETKKIAEFKDGDKGKIIGQIVFAGHKLVAPLSQRNCSYYYVLIEEYRSMGKGGTWITVFEDEKQGDVVISDGTGYCIIDTRSAIAHLVPDLKFRSGSFNDPPEEIINFLKWKNIHPKTLFGFNRSFRYYEGVLEEDEKCAVIGIGQWNIAKDHKLRIPAENVLVVTTDDNENPEVYISDHRDAVKE